MTNPEQEPANSTFFCPQCGNKVPKGASFCPNCTHKICSECGSTIDVNTNKCSVCGKGWQKICPACKGVLASADTVCPKCGLSFNAGKTASPPFRPTSGPGKLTPSQELLLSCGVCNRVDETVRVVSYPFVFSILILTFRRAFTGIWCRKHQFRYKLLSSLITSIFGWWGIPFGFIYTPVALFKLAKGGEQTTDQNLELLHNMTEFKLAKGDIEGAIRCAEETLRLRDTPEGRQKLDELYRRRLLSHKPQRQSVWPLLSLLPITAVLGFIIGVVDYGILQLVINYQHIFSTVFLGLFLWSMWGAAFFACGICLINLLEWAFQRSGCRSSSLSIVLSILSALAILYGSLQGDVTINLFRTVWSATNGEINLIATAPYFWLTLSSGAAWRAVTIVTSGEISDIIFKIIFVNSCVYLIWVSLRSGVSSSRWQRALGEVQEQRIQMLAEPRSHQYKLGWLAVFAAGICVFLAITTFPGWNTPSKKADNAWILINEGNIDQGVSELQNLVEGYPDISWLRFNLAVAYSAKGEFDKAEEELVAAIKLDNSLSAAHAFLALNSYITGEIDKAMQELQTAVEMGSDDYITQMYLGDVYYLMGDYIKAQESYQRAADLDPLYGHSQISLSTVYLAQADPDNAMKACYQAASLKTNIVDIQQCYADVHMYLEEFDKAWEACSAGLQTAPDDSILHSCLSWSSYRRGDLSAAVTEGEKALQLNSYNMNAKLHLAFIYLDLNKIDQSIAAAQEAIHYYPIEDSPHYVLGMCYDKQGNRKAAVEEFEKFLKLYRETPFTHELKTEVEAYLATQ